MADCRAHGHQTANDACSDGPKAPQRRQHLHERSSEAHTWSEGVFAVNRGENQAPAAVDLTRQYTHCTIPSCQSLSVLCEHFWAPDLLLFNGEHRLQRMEEIKRGSNEDDEEAENQDENQDDGQLDKAPSGEPAPNPSLLPSQCRCVASGQSAPPAVGQPWSSTSQTRQRQRDRRGLCLNDHGHPDHGHSDHSDANGHSIGIGDHHDNPRHLHFNLPCWIGRLAEHAVRGSHPTPVLPDQLDRCPQLGGDRALRREQQSHPSFDRQRDPVDIIELEQHLLKVPNYLKMNGSFCNDGNTSSVM